MPCPISIRALTKVFPAAGATGPITAVDRVDLEIGAGELFFLLGPSGCGKTTLLRMVAGFIEPTEGAVYFGERDVTLVAPNRRNTGMVFQSYALWPHMTVEDNVAFGLTVRRPGSLAGSGARIGSEERRRRVAEALSAVRMQDCAARRPNELSGGQQQRVALARALVVRPDVLLLDEPLSNLDARLRVELRAEIRRICKESGTTALYVTHDQKESLSMADRVAIIERGAVRQVGPPRDLYRRPASRFVAEFLGDTNLIAGRVGECSGARATVTTAIGPILADAPGDAARPGSAVLCSIRPEAVHLGAPATTNTFSGRVVETTFLGELAMVAIELSPTLRIRAALLNPGNDLPPMVTLAIDPRDVVVLRQD